MGARQCGMSIFLNEGHCFEFKLEISGRLEVISSLSSAFSPVSFIRTGQPGTVNSEHLGRIVISSWRFHDLRGTLRFIDG